MVDFKAVFYSAQNVFVEIHCKGKEKEVRAVLADPSKWPFKADFYSFILHDKDVDDDGELKVPHFHLLALTDLRQGKKKWLDTLAGMFPFLPREAFTISPMQSERSCNRYLTHIDYKEKHQYSKDECVSSNPRRFDRSFQEVKDDNPSWETICSWQTEAEIYETVGLKGYHRAKEVWKDTLNALERQNELEYLRGQNEALQAELNDLRRDIYFSISRVLDEVYPPELRKNDKKMFRDYETVMYAVARLVKGEKE